VSLAKFVIGEKYEKIAFADCHTDESPEFDAYPKHCMKGTAESEIVDEIKNIGGYTLIEKILPTDFWKKLSESGFWKIPISTPSY